MAISPYPVDPELTGLAIAYKNEEYIADAIAPYAPVGKRLFEWDEYPVEQFFQTPDTKVGRLSKPNEVTFSATRKPGSVEDYGLDSPIPQEDIDNADPGIDPKATATEGIMEYVKLEREMRVVSVVQNANTYLSTQRETLSGTSQFSHADSKPITKIKTAMDTTLLVPNAMAMGHEVWTTLSMHPEILKAVSVSGTDKGVATREAVAALFEIPAENLFVGKSRKNAAKPGQAASLVRLWGKHLSLFYKNPSATLRGMTTAPTFMLTPRFGTPISGSIKDPDIGLKGGERVRAGESVRELVISVHGAYYFQNAIA